MSLAHSCTDEATSASEAVAMARRASVRRIWCGLRRRTWRMVTTVVVRVAGLVGSVLGLETEEKEMEEGLHIFSDCITTVVGEGCAVGGSTSWTTAPWSLTQFRNLSRGHCASQVREGAQGELTAWWRPTPRQSAERTPAPATGPRRTATPLRLCWQRPPLLSSCCCLVALLSALLTHYYMRSTCTVGPIIRCVAYCQLANLFLVQMTVAHALCLTSDHMLCFSEKQAGC
ncbi:hypothetical protein SEVIR_2G012275v4 [Setaria viridis]